MWIWRVQHLKKKRRNIKKRRLMKRFREIDEEVKILNQRHISLFAEQITVGTSLEKSRRNDQEIDKIGGKIKELDSEQGTILQQLRRLSRTD